MTFKEYLGKMRGTTRGGPPRVSNSEVVWSWIGGFVGILAVSWLNQLWFEGADLTQAVEWEAGYLASGIRNMVYILAPERVVIGGGVAELPGLFPLLRRKLTASLGGYPGLAEHESDDFVVPAALGGMAGPLGSLVLAEQAVPASG